MLFIFLIEFSDLSEEGVPQRLLCCYSSLWSNTSILWTKSSASGSLQLTLLYGIVFWNGTPSIQSILCLSSFAISIPYLSTYSTMLFPPTTPAIASMRCAGSSASNTWILFERISRRTTPAHQISSE